MLVKMDLEGHDAPVWQDLIDSGILCRLRDHGVSVHLLLDNDNVDDTPAILKTWTSLVEHAKHCGAKLRKSSLRAYTGLSNVEKAAVLAAMPPAYRPSALAAIKEEEVETLAAMTSENRAAPSVEASILKRNAKIEESFQKIQEDNTLPSWVKEKAKQMKENVEAQSRTTRKEVNQTPNEEDKTVHHDVTISLARCDVPAQMIPFAPGLLST